MIIWATRKRFHLIARGEDDSNVLEAFRLTGWGSMYSALMAIVDVMLCTRIDRFQLHAVACRCLAPHEVCLLSSLADLQRDRDEDANHGLAQLMGPSAGELVMPLLRTIVQGLDEHGLNLTRATPCAVSTAIH
jgi:hypothetical protein